MRGHPSTPRKVALVLLFEAARRRLAGQRGDVAELPNTRIATATKELNRVTQDIREAQGSPEAPAPVIQTKPRLVISTVGKILRWSKTVR
jgi:hypothetical protein